MSAARLVLLLAGIGLFWVILRKLVSAWLTGPRREEMLEAIRREERGLDRSAGAEAPSCPLCGAPTRLHTYPHITVWRCTGYPDCRGFVKTRKPSRPKFAEDWDRKRRKR